ncbi:hypothetical protein MUP59_06550, partial [Candidatus Bathyarchaeota archaeon]|nr:hypothetical protein [Candidatus Bathyarchaeota archaeon]
MNIAFKLIALFACIPLMFSAIYCFKLDFSTAYPLSSDFVGRLSVNSWIYFIVLTIAVLLLYQMLADRWRWVIPFLLAGVFVVAFPLAQYPSVQNSDAYMHAGAARSLVEHGAIPEMTLYSEYPGSFIVLAVLSQVLNIPLLETSMLLSSVVNLLIVYLLIVLGELTVGKKWSWLVPTFYLVFSFRHYTTLVHYSPQLLGLTLYILFFIVLIHILRSPLRQWKAILIVLTAVIIVTHPFSAVFVVFSFFGIYLLTGRIRSPWR